MSYRYRFVVEFESPDECGIGVVPGTAEEGESPTGTEIAVVLHKLAALYANWPGTIVPVRYRKPEGS